MPNNKTWFLTHAHLWTPKGMRKNVSIQISGKQFGKLTTSSKKGLDVSSHYVLPGLIDLHVNGTAACDLSKDPKESLQRFSKQMALRGVTTYLPTLISTPLKKLIPELERLNQSWDANSLGATPLGLHLEGPFIATERKGAHSTHAIASLSEANLKKVLNAAGKRIKMMTLAPEKDPKGTGVRFLKKQGILPAMGHSNATYKQASRAVDLGYRYATHIFNAMAPWHHRQPGLAGAAMLNNQVYCEAIPDGNHLNFSILDMLYKIKEKDKLILASDEWIGFNKNINKDWKLHSGAIRTVKKGDLVGSGTSLLKGIQKWAKRSKRDWTALIPLVTINPSQYLGLSNKIGTIECGKQADFVVVTKDLDVRMTVVRGEVVYIHPQFRHKLTDQTNTR